MQPTPRLLIVDRLPDRRATACRALGAAGWTVDETTDGTPRGGVPPILATHRYSAILLDIDGPGADGFAAARAIRGPGSPDFAVPILAVTPLSGPRFEAEMRAADLDGHVPMPATAAQFVALVAPWWPDPDTPARQRLGAMLGAASLAALTASFAEQLAAALLAIDAPDVRVHAHRIAGLAGTLAFPGVYETWLALSEGAPDARHPAACAARRTLRAIAD